MKEEGESTIPCRIIKTLLSIEVGFSDGTRILIVPPVLFLD